LTLPLSLHNQITQIAQSYTAGLGDPSPESIQYVATDRQAAIAATSGGSVDSDQPVYLVVAIGKFAAQGVAPPGSTTVPTGSVMILVLDAQTLDITDWGVTTIVPKLTPLGQVQNLS
jgi:hypothetical protein